jgi:diacylglycerol kinase family enzyme/membrane-associated phospholipid phosphatase
LLLPRVLRPIHAQRRARVLPDWLLSLDRTIGDRINTQATPASVDTALARLSRAADRSKLWFAIGGVLFLVGGRSRSGAVRGLAGLAVASAVSNLVGKSLFGGDRPLLSDVPVGRRLRRTPTSPSFPSGHSASAAAFATGVALESPAAGAVVAPLTAAVAYSRIHTGAHWASDVVGGLAIGIGVALVGRALVPTRHQLRRRDPGPRVSLPVLEEGAGLFVVVNPSSGSGRASAALGPAPEQQIRRALPRADIHILAPADDLAGLFREAAERPGVLALGMSGGDGSVAVAAHAARTAHLPLVVFPGGTLNHFAGAAGIDSFADTIEAVRRGEGTTVDACLGDDPITVLNTASIGVYPELVEQREKLENAIGKWPAALVAGHKVLRRSEPVEFRRQDGPVRSWMLFVGVNRYHPRNIIPLSRRSLSDNLLDIRSIRADVSASRLRVFANLALGSYLSSWLRSVPGVGTLLAVHTETRTTMDFRVDASVAFAHDGEVRVAPPAGFPVSIVTVPGELRIYRSDRKRR